MLERPAEIEIDDSIVYSHYGDLAYPQSAYISGGQRNQLSGSAQALWNSRMSKV